MHNGSKKPLVLEKKNLLQIYHSNKKIKIMVVQNSEKNWMLSIGIEGYPEPGLLVGEDLQIRQWRSLDNIVGFIHKILPNLNKFEVNLNK